MKSYLSILILTLCGSAMADDVIIRVQTVPKPKAAVAQPVVRYSVPAVTYAPVVRYSVPAVSYGRVGVYAGPRVGFTGSVVSVSGYSVGRVRADDGSAVRRVRRTPLRTGLFGW